MNEPTVVAVFDLDGTLYTGHIIHGIAQHHRKHCVKRLRLSIFMVSHMALWPLCRTGLLSEASIRELWACHMAWTIAGWSPQEAETAFAWISEHYVRPLVRPDVLAQLQLHQESGHRVIIASGTLAPLLAEIGRQLGVSETVGTQVIIRKNRYTGACEFPVCQGPNKVLHLENYLNGQDILWSQSYAYTDSYTDISLLNRVGHPVAVYPDARLAIHATNQGWEIIG